jgi:apolipoprotein D and lipocalin family protein
MSRNLFCTLLLTLATGSAVADTLRNVPIDTLDLPRYLGTWHEVARLPNSYQEDCVSGTTAEYMRSTRGEIVVRNRCIDAQGEVMSVEGVGREVVAASGNLQVRFAPRWLSWLPVWADYWILDLDPEYRWAVVGGPTRKFLWVLAREPQLDAATFDGIKARAKARGYAVDRLTYPVPPQALREAGMARLR